MSSTTVRSENNQNKTEVTGMEIVFNTRENKYEIENGQTLDTVLKDHIQEQGEMGINAGGSHVEEVKNGSRLVTNDGTIIILDPRAVMIIAKQGKERRKVQGKEEKEKAEISR